MSRRKFLFEIPEENSNVIYAGRSVAIDGKTVVEVARDSECYSELMSVWGKEYCTLRWFNPVFIYSTGNLPMLVGFVHGDEILEPSNESPSPSLIPNFSGYF
jgi:hypothetical protein